jgi:hypothetical protein
MTLYYSGNENTYHRADHGFPLVSDKIMREVVNDRHLFDDILFGKTRHETSLVGNLSILFSNDSHVFTVWMQMAAIMSVVEFLELG